MIKKNRDEKKDIRNFGIALAVILGAIGSYRFYYKRQWDVALWLYAGGGMVIILSFFAPLVIKPLYRIMTIVGYKIGWVNQRLILGILFYLLFTPIAVVFKLIGKDPLERKIEVETNSYWIPRKESSSDKKKYEQQY